MYMLKSEQSQKKLGVFFIFNNIVVIDFSPSVELNYFTTPILYFEWEYI